MLRFDTLQDYITCAICTQGSHVKCMKESTSRAPHTFPLCLTCWRQSEPLGRADRAHFSPSLWSWVCDWGLGFAVFWREVTVFLNAKHLKYLRPLSPFRFKEMARSSGLVAVHEGPQITFACCSSNWVKQRTSWSCDLIYWTVSFCFAQVRSDDWRHV